MPGRPRDAAATAPTAEQELLLRAVLLEGTAAREAYRRWCAASDIEHLDEGSYRLLPQLYRNLLRFHGDRGFTGDAVGRRLKGVFRHTWTANQLALRLAQSGLGHLAAAGVVPLVLPEASLLQFYGHVGARPIESLKLLLRDGELPAALRVLAAEGWGPLPPGDCSESHRALTGIRLDLGDQRLDLVARVLPNCASPDTDDAFRADARTATLGLSALTLSPADELLYACRRATQWEEVPSFRWLADGFMVVSNGGTLDWDGLRSRAERYGAALALAETARYLGQALGAAIPPSVWTPRASPGWVARLDHRVRGRRPGVLGRLPLLLLAFMHGHRAASLPRRLAGLPRFLQREWRVRSGVDLARYVLRGVGRILRRGWQGG